MQDLRVFGKEKNFWVKKIKQTNFTLEGIVIWTGCMESPQSLVSEATA